MLAAEGLGVDVADHTQGLGPLRAAELPEELAGLAVEAKNCVEVAEGHDELIAPGLNRVDVDGVVDGQSGGARLADLKDHRPPARTRLGEGYVLARVPAP